MSISYHIADCHKILDANPQDWDTRLRLADLLDELGEANQAQRERWIVEQKPDFEIDESGKFFLPSMRRKNIADDFSTRKEMEDFYTWWNLSKFVYFNSETGKMEKLLPFGGNSLPLGEGFLSIRDRLAENQSIEMDNKRSKEWFNKLFGENTNES